MNWSNPIDSRGYHIKIITKLRAHGSTLRGNLNSLQNRVHISTNAQIPVTTLNVDGINNKGNRREAIPKAEKHNCISNEIDPYRNVIKNTRGNKLKTCHY